MSKKRQVENSGEVFRVAAKSAITRRRTSITAVAGKLGFARNTVSMAINRYKFPRVLAALRKELNLAE